MGAVAAADGHVTGAVEGLGELEFYRASDDRDPAAVVAVKSIGFPLPILAISNNGMLQVTHGGQPLWVIADDVLTDLQRRVDAGCEPKLAGAVVAHGKRGAGEGCN